MKKTAKYCIYIHEILFYLCTFLSGRKLCLSVKRAIGNNDNDVIRLLCIKVSQMIGYVKHFHSSYTMPLKANGNKLLKVY